MQPPPALPPRHDHVSGTRWVLLRHELDDGTWHHDLCVERRRADRTAATPEHRLLTLRVPPSVDPPPPGVSAAGEPADCPAFVAQRLRDHRAASLDFEGPTRSGGGRVSRVARGPGVIAADGPGRCTLILALGPGGTDAGSLTTAGVLRLIFDGAPLEPGAAAPAGAPAATDPENRPVEPWWRFVRRGLTQQSAW